MSFDLQPYLKGELIELRPRTPGDWDELFAVASFAHLGNSILSAIVTEKMCSEFSSKTHWNPAASDTLTTK